MLSMIPCKSLIFNISYQFLIKQIIMRVNRGDRSCLTLGVQFSFLPLSWPFLKFFFFWLKAYLICHRKNFGCATANPLTPSLIYQMTTMWFAEKLIFFTNLVYFLIVTGKCLDRVCFQKNHIGNGPYEKLWGHIFVFQ